MGRQTPILLAIASQAGRGLVAKGRSTMCQSQPLDQSEECAGAIPGDHESSRSRCVPQEDVIPCGDIVARAEEIARSESAAFFARVRGKSPQSRVMIPFVVQHGTQLFMLASESSEWVLAELRFDEELLVFSEVRKARYAWPREAFGSLLSRVAVSGNVDTDLVEETTAEFSRWLGAQFQVNSGDA